MVRKLLLFLRCNKKFLEDEISIVKQLNIFVYSQSVLDGTWMVH